MMRFFGPRVGQKPHNKEIANAFGRDISVWAAPAESCKQNAYLLPPKALTTYFMQFLAHMWAKNCIPQICFAFGREISVWAAKTVSEILFATAEGINTCFNAVFGPLVGQKPHIKETANAFGRDISVWGRLKASF
jgi:hypothetical protein